MCRVVNRIRNCTSEQMFRSNIASMYTTCNFAPGVTHMSEKIAKAAKENTRTPSVYAVHVVKDSFPRTSIPSNYYPHTRSLFLTWSQDGRCNFVLNVNFSRRCRQFSHSESSSDSQNIRSHWLPVSTNYSSLTSSTPSPYSNTSS